MKKIITPAALIAILSGMTAFAAWIVNKDISLTRIHRNENEFSGYAPANVSPQTAAILSKLSWSDWKYQSNTFDTTRPSRPTELMQSSLKESFPNGADHRKLWDLLDESYINGPDLLPGRVLAKFASSIYFADPTNQEGFCQYLETRNLLAVYELISRRDYAGVRELSDEANSWIDSFSPLPSLASSNPQLQGHVNFFRRLDAVMQDQRMLRQYPSEGEAILKQLTERQTIAPDVLRYLQESNSPSLKAWGYYLAGGGALANFQYLNAAADFTRVIEMSENPKLRELAILGYVRSNFWAFKANIISRAAAQDRIIKAAKKLPKGRFQKDVKYYAENAK